MEPIEQLGKLESKVLKVLEQKSDLEKELKALKEKVSQLEKSKTELEAKLAEGQKLSSELSGCKEKTSQAIDGLMKTIDSIDSDKKQQPSTPQKQA